MFGLCNIGIFFFYIMPLCRNHIKTSQCEKNILKKKSIFKNGCTQKHLTVVAPLLLLTSIRDETIFGFMSSPASSWINKVNLRLPLARSRGDRHSPTGAPCSLAVTSLSPAVYLESPGLHMSGDKIVESRSGSPGIG